MSLEITAKAKFNARQLQRQRVADEEIWRSRISGYFARAKKPVLESLRSDDYLTTLYNLDTLLPVKPLYDLYTQLYTQLGRKFYYTTLNGLKSTNRGYNTKAEEDEWTRAVNLYIETEVATRITGVNGVTKKAIEKVIQETITEATEQGLSIPNTQKLLVQRVDKKFIQMRKGRARLIARTEMGSVANFASYNGAVQAALNTGLKVKKAWLSYKDNRTRTDHFDMNSSDFIPIDDYFNVGGSLMLHPNQIGAPAAQVCNCRCGLIYETSR